MLAFALKNIFSAVKKVSFSQQKHFFAVKHPKGTLIKGQERVLIKGQKDALINGSKDVLIKGPENAGLC